MYLPKKENNPETIKPGLTEQSGLKNSSKAWDSLELFISAKNINIIKIHNLIDLKIMKNLSSTSRSENMILKVTQG